MIDTKHLGAGSYPEPPEPKKQWYRVQVSGSFKGYVDVFEKDVTTAVYNTMNNNYDPGEVTITHYDIEDIGDCDEV